MEGMTGEKLCQFAWIAAHICLLAWSIWQIIKLMKKQVMSARQQWDARQELKAMIAELLETNRPLSDRRAFGFS